MRDQILEESVILTEMDNKEMEMKETGEEGDVKVKLEEEGDGK